MKTTSFSPFVVIYSIRH